MSTGDKSKQKKSNQIEEKNEEPIKMVMMCTSQARGRGFENKCPRNAHVFDPVFQTQMSEFIKPTNFIIHGANLFSNDV